ncbi:MAG: ribonuclease Z [Clostridiales bacterium]|nr:ribonuclease Z [Clostridiales bacterium]
MRLIILGSCSGTQPFPGRHHTSFIIEHRGKLYWFDAGETCSYTAHCMGLDLLKSSKIVISHTHMDHIGGLGNLLWTVRKLNGISGDFSGKRLDIYIPQVESYEAIIKMLQSTQGNFSADFELEAHEIKNGLLFEEDSFKVTALHNRHIQNEPSPEGKWFSFGFLIEAQGKRIVYSGDTKGLEDFMPLLSPKVDILLMESGHHHPVDFAKELKESPLAPEKLFFIHHGRRILDDYDNMLSGLQDLWGDRVRILDDKDIIDL